MRNKVALLRIGGIMNDVRVCSLGEDLLPQVAAASALDAVQVVVNSGRQSAHRARILNVNALVRAVYRYINDGVLVDVSKQQLRFDDQLLGLEAYDAHEANGTLQRMTW